MDLRLYSLICTCLCALHVTAQSNYATHGNNVEYQGEGLPEQTILDGKVTKLDDLSPVIFLNRTKAALNCAAGSMLVELKFNEPFFGIAYADFDRNSACQVAGKGSLNYQLELPLKGCGTKQKPQRVFTNNIVVRFHPGLEMDGDEVITIVCRYPPPIAPPPVAIPAPILEPVPPIPLKPPLEGYQILLIICAILFLSLLLLGLGCSYYCLKNRRVRVVHRHPFSSVGTGSEITKLSGSSLGNISMFEGLKIPRAHAPATATVSSSSLEQALIPSEHSDTLPSDYPSESPSSAHSEVEDVDTRSLGSYQNQAFVPEEPKFDVQVRVKRAPPPPPASPSASSSDVESVMAQQARNLSTILEREESIRSLDVVPKPIQAKSTSFTYVPELHPPPAPSPAHLYSRVIRKERVKTDLNIDLLDAPPLVQKKPAPPPPSILPMKAYETALDIQQSEDIEPPLVVSRRPEITSHMVDDVFLRTITEKKTIEDIERHKRLVTEYHSKQIPLNPKWDVTIRNYPAPGQTIPRDPVSDWDSYSETSTASGAPPEQHRSEININRHYTSSMNLPPPDPSVNNWDVLIRVLEPPPTYTSTEVIQIDEPSTEILTATDREKWRQIITTESTLRTLLTEAVVREDYERISHDQRYERLFEPQKWEVIIRILAPPERATYDKNGQPNNVRYKKKQDWDNRSRRSSLPTLYEYDSDGSSVRTLIPDIHGQSSAFQDLRTRKSSRSSFRSDGVDVRSMTEVMVDYSRADRADTLSDVSSRPSSYYRHSRHYDDEDVIDGYGGSMVRSLSQPSLARSASEFTEHWTTTRKWDPETTEPSSPEHSPRSVRSGRTSIAGSTVSTQRRRQAIINKTLGTGARNLGTTSGLSRSSESVLEPNEAITPFNKRENELFSANRLLKQEMSAMSKSDGRLDDVEHFASTSNSVQQQQVVYKTTKTSSQTVKQTKFKQGWR